MPLKTTSHIFALALSAALLATGNAQAREHFFVGFGAPGYYAYPAPYPYYPYAYPVTPAPAYTRPVYAPPPPPPGYVQPGYGYPAPAPYYR